MQFKFNLKRFFWLSALLLALTGFGVNFVKMASAEDYPSKPVQLVIGFGQGGPTDVAARIMADKLSEVLGQQVYVENRPGASGNVATKTVADADADGYSYLIGALPLAVNHSRFPDFPVKFERDIVAVAGVGATNNVLVVHPSVKANTVEEFVQLARDNPDSLSCGTFGKGFSSHLAVAEFMKLANIKLVEVPYKKNSDTVSDILGGHISCWFAPITSVAALIEDGKLIALGVTGPERIKMLSEVPTFAELGYDGFDVRLWVGLFARKQVPQDKLQKMEQAALGVLASDDMQAALLKNGLEPMALDAKAFTEFVNVEIDRWTAIGTELR